MKVREMVFYLVFIFLFFPASGVLKSQDTAKDVDKPTVLMETILQTADRYISAKDYANARKQYEKLKGLEQIEYAKELALFNISASYRLEKNYAAAHKTYDEILKIPSLTPCYRIYCLFNQADTYLEEKDYRNARKLYAEILKTKDVSKNQVFRAELFTGDTYRLERKYGQARSIYERLLRQEDASSYPNEHFRLEVVDRLEELERVKDGQVEKSVREKRAEVVNSPKYGIYVSLQGSDTNPGTKEKPFATIKRAQEEVRRIKKEKGMPEEGIVVYLRGGKYFLSESIVFEEEDSGMENAPVVYRSYPGEEARLIGGRQIGDFKLLDDPDILNRLPEESRGKVWVADLKEEGITDYGHLRNRGTSYSGIDTAAMELFYNSQPMRLSRWPDEGWERVTDIVTPEGDGKVSGYIFQKGKFRYSGDRPERWAEEKDIWTAGYFMWPWDKVHTQVIEIDTDNHIISLAPDIRWSSSYSLYHMPVVKDTPYYFYNILAELSMPEEFYIDREAGRLYFYPPDKISNSEIIVSTLDAPIMELKKVSNVVLYGLTFECTWRNAITMDECRDTLVAGSTIRNTGNLGVIIDGGMRNGIVGCDIYDTGEGGIRVSGGDWKKLIPGGHCIENNHLYRVNRFSHGGGKYAMTLSGVGNRISHNLIHDTSYIGVSFSGNNQVVEYNEFYDVMNEGRDGGAIYTYGAPRYLMNRGNVMKYNFIHHITQHSSPLKTHQVTGLYIDAFNGGMTMEGNIFYRCTERAMFTHGPDTRIENNIFADCNLGITQSNRTYLLREDRSVQNWKNNVLDIIHHRQPPWSVRYPQVRDILKRKPYGEPRNIVIERNVFSNTPAVNISGDFIYEDNSIKNNFEEGFVFFRDKENLDFRIRPGSPVFSITGGYPLPFEEIGLYKDALRASWPPKRTPAGKYYKPGWKAPVEDASVKFPVLKKVSREKEYEVVKRINPITIDGVLNKDEWMGLDKAQAICVQEDYLTGIKIDSPKVYAWITYDKENIYLAVECMPDIWKEGLPKEKGNLMAVHEFAIEGRINQNTWWWQEGVPTGPLYVFTGRPDGRFIVHNLFNMPADVINKLQQQIEYKVVVIDKENFHWTAEWKIPLALVNVNPAENNSARFNMGYGKADWFAWVATGSAIWRVDNAGILKFQ